MDDFLKSLQQQSQFDQFQEAATNTARCVYFYYNSLVACGFTPEAAQAMILQYHQILWTRIFFAGGINNAA